jgi:Flp pilus assembly protein TadD
VAAALHKNLGLALCSNGNLDECKQELQEALKLNPTDTDVVKALNVAQKQ